MTHLRSVSAGTRIRSVELTFTLEFDNRSKEMPFRAWSEEGGTGLHIVTDAMRGEMVKGFLRETLPVIIHNLEEQINA